MPYLFRSVVLIVSIIFLCDPCSANEIRKGMDMQVSGGSIWFQSCTDLAESQRTKRDGDNHSVDVLEADVFGRRIAWRFSKSILVNVKHFDPNESCVEVEMKSEGRLRGSSWFVDVRELQ